MGTLDSIILLALCVVWVTAKPLTSQAEIYATATATSIGEESSRSSSKSSDKTTTTSFSCEYSTFPNPAANLTGPCSTAAVDGWCVCNSQTYGIISSGKNVCGYTAPPPTGTTTLCASTTSTPTPPPSPTVSCTFDAVDKFTLCGTDWNNTTNGVRDELKKQLQQCGKLTEWQFPTPWNGCDFVATGHLPILNGSCLEIAIKNSGGPTFLDCIGPKA